MLLITIIESREETDKIQKLHVFLQAKSEEIESRQDQLKQVEELGAKVEKDRIFDNK